MIIYHKNNIAAFKGAHIRYRTVPKRWRISQTSAAPTPSSAGVQTFNFIGLV